MAISIKTFRELQYKDRTLVKLEAPKSPPGRADSVKTKQLIVKAKSMLK